MLRIIITFVILVITATVSNGLSSSDGNGVCEHVYSVQVSRYIPYTETYKKKIFGVFHRTESRLNYRIEYHTEWHNVEKCCKGYSEHNSICEPVCLYGCENGYCFKPNECLCNSGYTKNHTQSAICDPICYNECIRGRCSGPNVCTCNFGYSLSSDGFTCEPVCDNCPETSICIAPNVCECVSNYKMTTKVDGLEGNYCAPICERTCVNSDCVAPNVCKCREGYVDLDGDAFTCTPKCSSVCNFGTCTAPEVCTCNDGYSRFGNDSSCQPVCNQTCINGVCIAPDICSCSEGYAFMDNSDSTCEPVCTEICENGRCTEPQICSCNGGYQMNNESKCKPICTQPCFNGNCTAPEYCTCFDGYNKAENSTHLCEPICNTTCENGHCSAPGECTCNESFEKNENDECVPECKCIHGTCSGENRNCVCEEGYELSGDKNSTICVAVCDNGCENGKCIAPQKCECRESYVMNNVTTNTCISVCGVDCRHGFCLPEKKACSCFYGWSGKTCEVVVKCAAIFNGDDLKSKLNVVFNESESKSKTEIDTNWKDQICDENCLHDVNNETECFMAAENSSTIICFFDMDLQCNFVSLQRSSSNNDSIMWSGIMMTMYVVIAGTILLAGFLLLRHYTRNKELISKDCVSDSFQDVASCLIEEEGTNL